MKTSRPFIHKPHYIRRILQNIWPLSKSLEVPRNNFSLPSKIKQYLLYLRIRIIYLGQCPYPFLLFGFLFRFILLLGFLNFIFHLLFFHISSSPFYFIDNSLYIPCCSLNRS